MKITFLFLIIVISACSSNEKTGNIISTNKYNGDWVMKNHSIWDSKLVLYKVTLPDSSLIYAKTFKIEDSTIVFKYVSNRSFRCAMGLLYIDSIKPTFYEKHISLNFFGEKIKESTFNYSALYSINIVKDSIYLDLKKILENKKESLR
jgi:hypothetical protein